MSPLMRELTEQEMEFVSGGQMIVVTGQRISSSFGFSTIGGSWRSGDASAREDMFDNISDEEWVVLGAGVLALGLGVAAFAAAPPLAAVLTAAGLGLGAFDMIIGFNEAMAIP